MTAQLPGSQVQRSAMFALACLLGSLSNNLAVGQAAPRTIAAVFAHGDDEGSVAPILARYARQGDQVYLLIATDGAQGGSRTTIARGPDLARARADEARCAAAALGIKPPILLEFPDSKLGDYGSDPSLLYRLTQRIQEELQRLKPDVLITWGPDGGMGHPDHRLVGNVVTQLVRAGAPGVPERLFYAYLGVEGFRVLYPQRAAPPFMIPQQKYFSARISFGDQDLKAGRASLACHKTQYPEDVQERLFPVMVDGWKGVISLVPDFATSAAVTDLFPSRPR